MSIFDRLRRKGREGAGPPTGHQGRAGEEGEPRVQLFDVPMGTVTTIPARELAPGMIRVQVNGVEGDCWVRPD